MAVESIVGIVIVVAMIGFVVYRINKTKNNTLSEGDFKRDEDTRQDR